MLSDFLTLYTSTKGYFGTTGDCTKMRKNVQGTKHLIHQ